MNQNIRVHTGITASLITKDVIGLMLVGRNISGGFFAHSSYYVNGNAVSLGEAAGEIAALVALKNMLPQHIIHENSNYIQIE